MHELHEHRLSHGHDHLAGPQLEKSQWAVLLHLELRSPPILQRDSHRDGSARRRAVCRCFQALLHPSSRIQCEQARGKLPWNMALVVIRARCQHRRRLYPFLCPAWHLDCCLQHQGQLM
jgi:hypothetical protein